MNKPTLETERLLLRRFTEAEIDALYALWRDEEVNTFLPWFPAECVEDARRFYEERYAAVYARPRGYAYAVCLKAGGGPIGYIKVETVSYTHLENRRLSRRFSIINAKRICRALQHIRI